VAVLILLIGAAILLSGANDSLLYRYDDAFFAATARNIAEHGNWLDLKLRGEPVLVYEHPGDYCFDCDTFAYFNGVQAQPYSEDQLRTWLAAGPVRVFGLRRFFDRDRFEVPAGIDFTTLYADERAAVFEARDSAGTPAHRVGWPGSTNEWPGSRGFEVRRIFREDATR